MKKILILFLISTISQAQDSIRISGHLKGNTTFAKVIVKKFGIGSFDISEVTIKDERFKISAPLNIEEGVYRFQYNQSSINGYVDIIVTGKENKIDFEMDVTKPDTTPVFNESEENKKWYNYIRDTRIEIQKIELLGQLIGKYPSKKDIIVSQLNQAFDKEKKKYKSNLREFITANRNTFAKQIVENKPYYFCNPNDTILNQDLNRRNNYWKGIDTNNPRLVNTPVYIEHILNYLRYYMNPEMHFNETEIESGFKKSVDTIMSKFAKNQDTRKFALKYLQLGFKEIGQEKVLQYIDEKFKETIEQCSSDNEKAVFEKRMKGYAAMKPGSTAPNIFFADKTGKIISLKDLNTDNTIIVFWASWCPHCTIDIPKLEVFAKNNPKTSVLCVSLDDDKQAYDDAIKNYGSLYHSCDFLRWQSKTVGEYYISGTPTYIIIDRNQKIIGKYDSWNTTEMILTQITH